MRLRTLTLLLTLTAFGAAAPKSPAAAARSDAWSVIGPGGGGSMFNATVSPHDPNLVLVSCDMTGAYISKDGGVSWRMFNLRGVAQFFVFDPLDRKTIYVQVGGLWRSRDAGVKWELVYPEPAQVKSVSMDDDHASERILTASGPTDRVTALAVDPSDSSVLYVGMRSQSGHTLRISADAGKSWKSAGDLSSPASRLYVDPKSPRGNRTVYVVGANAVTVLEAGKLTTRAAAPGVTTFDDVSGAWAKDGKLVLYGVSKAGVTVSDDGGLNWRHSAGALSGARVQAIAAAASNAAIAYASYSGLRLDGAGWFGVARTSDRGRTWSLVWKESRRPSSNIEGGWLTERFGPDWPANPYSLGVAPGNPDLCFSTDSGRAMRTADGGATWKSMTSRRLPSGGYTTTGLDVTTTYGVHFDPFDRQRVFISYTDVGLMGSEDGGVSWASATQRGVPPPWVNTTYWMEFDPQVKGRVWAVMSYTHDLPRPKMWRNASPASYRGGVLRSEDGGRSWRALNRGIPATAPTQVLLDPRSPAQSRVLYVAAFGKGVFKSLDGGETWALKNKGIDGHEPFAWRLAQDPAGILYLVVARRSDDGSIGTPNDGALYRSTDGAESWQRVALPSGVNGPNGLAIDPKDPKRLYLAAWRRAGFGGGGIFLSNDAGRSWRSVHAADQHVYDITVDPRGQGTLYASGFSSSAWRSTDRGETWRRIPGYNFKWGHRVVPDPYDPKMIYITTFGGSVWYGPAAGDPQAREDIATPVLAPLTPPARARSGR